MDPRFSAFAAQLRQATPSRANWSDDAILYQALSEAKRQNVLDQIPELAEYEKQTEKDSRGITGEFKQAFGSGVDNFQAKLYDTAALAGDLTGIDRLKNWGEEGRERNEEEAKRYEPIVANLEQVKSPSDFAYWLSNIVGSNAPQMGGTMAAAAGASLLAPAGAVGAGATGLAGVGVRIGAALGMGEGATAAAGLSSKALAGFLASSAVGFSQMQNYGELKELGGEDVIPISIANGLIGSVLEAYGPASMMAKMTKSVGRDAALAATHSILDRVPAPVMNVALGLAKEGSKEMLTEIVQEASTIGSEVVSNRNNPNYAISDDQVVSRLMNNGAAGFILGGIGGALTEHGHKKQGNAEGAATSPREFEQPAAVTPASLDAPIPAIRTEAPKTSDIFPAATPAPAPAATTPPATATTERVLASPQTQELLRARGVDETTIATISEIEAQRLIQATPTPTPQVVAPPSNIPAQEAAAAEARAVREQAEAAAARAQLEADARAELAKAQPQFAVPTPPAPKPAPTVVRMNRAQFRAAANPGETVAAPSTPAEIRKKANLFRSEGDAEFYDFKSGTKMNVPAPAPVEPFKVITNETPKTQETAKTGAVTPPVGTPPVVESPAPDAVKTPSTPPPAAVPANPVAPLPKLTGSFRASRGDTPIGLRDLTFNSRERGEAHRTTRNAAVIRQADGSFMFVPVFNDNETARVLDRGAHRSQAELEPEILKVARETIPDLGKMGVRTLHGVLQSRDKKSAIGMAKAERNAKLQELGEKMGWYRDKTAGDSPTLTSLLQDEQGVKKAGVDLVDVLHFEQPIQPGIRKMTDAEIAAIPRDAIQADFFKGKTVKVGKDVSLDQKIGDTGKTVHEIVAAPEPERPAPPAKPTVSPPKVDVGSPDPDSPVHPALASVRLDDAMLHDIAGRIDEDDVSRMLKITDPGKLVKTFLQKAGNLIDLAGGDAVAFKKMTADEQHNVMRRLLIEVSAQQSAGDNGVTYRRQPADYRPTTERVQEVFNTVLRTASRMGIDVSVFQTSEGPANKFFHEEGGAYIPSKRSILLVMNNTIAPTIQNTMSALHEVIHDVVATEPVWVQKLLHDMIERLPIGERAYLNNPAADPRVQSNAPGLTNEKLVEHLTQRGLQREYATNVLARFWRSVTHVFTKAAMWAQQSILGAENTGGFFAQKYAENRVAQIVAGDLAGKSFLDRINPTPSMGLLRRSVFSNDTWHTAAGYPFSFENTAAAARYNIMAPIAEAKERLQLDGTAEAIRDASELAELVGTDAALLRNQPQAKTDYEINNAREKMLSNTRVIVAANNLMVRFFDRAFEQAKAAYPTRTREQILADRRAGLPSADNLTLESFIKAHGIQNPSALKANAILSLKNQIEAEIGKDAAEKIAFDDKIEIDNLKENEKVAAEYMVAQTVGDYLVSASNRHTSSRTELSVRSENFEKNAANIRAIDKEIASYDASDKIVRSFIRESIAQLKKDLKLTDRTAEAFGAVNATLRALENEASNSELSTKFTDNVLGSLDVEQVHLPSIFNQLFKLETDGIIDLSNSSPAAIRAAIMDEVTLRPDSSLSQLVELGDGPDAVPRGTALLATVVAYAKQHAHMVDTIRLQLSTDPAAKADLQRIRDLLREQNVDNLNAIRDTVAKDLKRPGNRAIYSWLKRKDAAIRENAIISRLQRETEFLAPSIAALKDTMARIDQRRGIGHELHIVPGSMLMVPPSVDADSETVRNNLVEVSMGREQWLKSDKVVEILKAQKEWLDARLNKPELHDDVYNTIARNYDRLRLLAGSDRIYNSVGRFNSGIHLSIVEELKRTNTRAGQQAARLWNMYDEIQRAHQVDMIATGKKWEAPAEKFYRDARLSANNAHEMFYDPALFFLNDRPDLTEAEAFVKLREMFSLSPATAEVASNDAKWKSFEEWMKSTKRANQKRVSIMKERGVGVRDESITRVNPSVKYQEGVRAEPTSTVREALERGVTGYTVPQRLHRKLAQVIHTFSDLLQARSDAKTNPFLHAELAVQLAPEELGRAMNDVINRDPAFKDVFLEPLLTDTSRSRLPAPAREDNTRMFVPPSTARMAWEASNGDVMQYAAAVYKIMGTSGDTTALRQYQADVIRFIGGKFHAVDKLVSRNTDVHSSVKGLAHYAMDSRVGDNFPRAWLTYEQFSAEDNRRALHTIAANAAFGPEYREIDGLYSNVVAELARLAKDVSEADAAGRAELKKKHGADWLALREDAEQKIRRAENFGVVTRQIFDPTGGAMDEHGLFMELLSGTVSGMVMGLRGAIKNLLSMIDTMALERSVSTASFQTVARGYGAFGRNFLAGLAGVFGPDLMRHNRYVRLIDAAGGFDVAPRLNVSDMMKGTRGVDNNFDKSAFGKVQRVARMARNVVTNARLGASGGNTGPALRAINWFSYTQIASNYAVTEALLKRYEELALRGAEYYKANPDKVGQPLTAKLLGYADEKGFTGMRNEALDQGFTIEELAEKAARRQDKNVELFDKQIVQKVMNLTLSRVSGESSPANRPAYMLTSKFGRMNGMLVGWNFFKTAQVLQLLRSPEGRRDVRALLAGAKVMALGMVPMAIAFSKLLDEYDEDVMKKRNNLKDLAGDDLFGAIIERSVAMGSFGLAGNVLDTMMNYKDGTGRFALSVDQNIVWLNSIEQMIKLTGAMVQMGPDNANWANLGRPMAQAVGLGGVLQYVQIANNLFPETLKGVPLFEWEAGVNARINAGNILRAAGREIGMEVRAQGGSATPNEVTPWITNMALATYRDNPEDFQEAYRGAIQAAREMGQPDPFEYVKRAFQTRNPLKSVFRVTPTETEVMKIMSGLNDFEQKSVREAISLFNRYGNRLGIDPYFGTDGTSKAAMARMVKQRQLSVGDMRSILASRRTESDDTSVDR